MPSVSRKRVVLAENTSPQYFSDFYAAEVHYDRRMPNRFAIFMVLPGGMATAGLATAAESLELIERALYCGSNSKPLLEVGEVGGSKPEATCEYKGLSGE